MKHPASSVAPGNAAGGSTPAAQSFPVRCSRISPVQAWLNGEKFHQFFSREIDGILREIL